MFKKNYSCELHRLACVWIDSESIRCVWWSVVTARNTPALPFGRTVSNSAQPAREKGNLPLQAASSNTPKTRRNVSLVPSNLSHKLHIISFVILNVILSYRTVTQMEEVARNLLHVERCHQLTFSSYTLIIWR